MSTHKICFYGELVKIIPEYHQIRLLKKSSVVASEMHMYVAITHFGTDCSMSHREKVVRSYHSCFENI